MCIRGLVVRFARVFVQRAVHVAARNGRVGAKTRAVDSMRAKLNLPELQDPDLEEVHKIMEASGFNEILAKYADEEGKK